MECVRVYVDWCLVINLPARHHFLGGLSIRMWMCKMGINGVPGQMKTWQHTLMHTSREDEGEEGVEETDLYDQSKFASRTRKVFQ